MSNTRALIDLGRLQANAAAFMAASPEGLDLMAVVKANAYGHGATACARALRDVGATAFAVATLAEAEHLRRAQIDEPILVFAPPLPDQLPAFQELSLDVSITNLDLLASISSGFPDLLRRGHIKFDTGMARVGLQPGEVGAMADILRKSGVDPKAFWTHLAFSANRPDHQTREQVAVFRSCLAECGVAAPAVHLLNTGGFLHHPELRCEYEGQSFSRIGIGLYGVAHTENAPDPPLQPVMKVVSRILQVKTVPKGAGVSYGHTWHAPTDRWIATVGAGYADGVPRLLSNRGWVGHEESGDHYPIVGNVCMDMFMIDLGPTDRVREAPTIRVGDEVVLVGDGGPDARAVAAWAETIAYEVCTGISPRVERHYVNPDVVY